MLTHKTKIRIIIGISTIAVAALFFSKRIVQDSSYHAFADARTLLSIPNCMNVLSNLLMLIVGAVGVYFIATHKLRLGFSRANLCFFIALLLTSIGSAYYHYQPNNSSLVWDRLPMTITFMSFFAIILYEFISKSLSHKLFIPLIGIGLASILYWQLSKLAGFEDLRLYVLVQFLPLVLIMVIALLYKSSFKKTAWIIVGIYALAKLSEHFDYQIYLQTLNILSGHSLKHVLAGVAPLIYLLYLRRKQEKQSINYTVRAKQNFN